MKSNQTSSRSRKKFSGRSPDLSHSPPPPPTAKAPSAWSLKPEPISKKPPPTPFKNSMKSPAIPTASSSPPSNRSISTRLITSPGSASPPPTLTSPPRLSTTSWSAVSAPALSGSMGYPQVGVRGSVQSELHIIVDPVAMAQRGITYAALRQAITSANANFSGGKLADGKRDIRVRATGRFQDPESVENMVVRRNDSGTIYLRDIATVETAFQRTHLLGPCPRHPNALF